MLRAISINDDVADFVKASVSADGELIGLIALDMIV
jgi:hypothetical protein